MNYVALVWNPEDLDQQRSARAMIERARNALWRTVLDRSGLTVLCHSTSDSDLHRVYSVGSHGVVIGRLFPSGPTTSIPAGSPAQTLKLDRALCDCIFATGGSELMRACWGQYVAFIADPETGMRRVLRDPSGSVPCQRITHEGVDIYFNRLQDVEQLATLTYTINRSFLFGFMLHGGRNVRETCITEIDTLMAGECATYYDDSRSLSFLWTPASVASDEPITELPEAIRLMRVTTEACVHAWASCFDRILLSLSGGLDSSIVAACLHSAPTQPEVVCRTFFAEGPNSDERTFARATAQQCGFRLIEERVDTHYTVDGGYNPGRMLFPTDWPVNARDLAAEREFFESLNIDAVFDGHGGDEVFSRLSAFPTAVDYVWHNGARLSALSVALHDADAMNTSLWRVLRFIYRFAVRKARWRPGYGSSDIRPLLSAELKSELKNDARFAHPQYRMANSLPPGKFEQACLLTSLTGSFYNPLAEMYRSLSLSPLVSQPLLELSLRIPVYLLRLHGTDRAVARAAFATDLPPQIIRRKSKGFGNAQARNVLQTNIDHVREVLLNGFLVQERFVDRSALEAVLSGDMSTADSNVLEICDLMATERWVSSWRSALSGPYGAGGGRLGAIG